MITESNAATQTGSLGERIFAGVALGVAAISAGNGAFMLLRPAPWFATTPGAAETGAFNPHLVQDVGIAFLAVALCYLLAVLQPAARLPLLLTGAVFLAGHGLLHLAEAASDHHASDPIGLAATAGIGVIAALLPLAAGRGKRHH